MVALGTVLNGPRTYFFILGLWQDPAAQMSMVWEAVIDALGLIAALVGLVMLVRRSRYAVVAFLVSGLSSLLLSAIAYVGAVSLMARGTHPDTVFEWLVTLCPLFVAMGIMVGIEFMFPLYAHTMHRRGVLR